MARKFLTGIDLSNQRAANLADASSATDAVTLQQLQAAVRGLDWKPSVRATTTASITLSAPQTIDGVAVVAGDRVLVKNQTPGAENGLYLVQAAAWTRTTDADEGAELTAALAVTVESGTVGGDKVYILTTDAPITIGTTALAFAVLGGGGAAYTAGNGLALAGSVFSVQPVAGGGITVTGAGVALDVAVAARRFAIDVPAGATSAAITHGLGTQDVDTTVYVKTTGEVVDLDVVNTSATVTTLTFAVAPTAGQYRAVVVG